MAEGKKHKELSQTAINWLYCRGCSVFANEVPTWNGKADAIGIITKDRRYGIDDTVYYIEAKASRSDLLSEKQKKCYEKTKYITGKTDRAYGSDENDIDFFYFIISDEIKVEKSLYPNWGVINENGKVMRRAKRMKKGKNSYDLITILSHILVYKVFGKMYLF